VRCNGEALPGGLQPGDLAVWDGHVAMIDGNGLMVEAKDQWGCRPVAVMASTPQPKHRPHKPLHRSSDYRKAAAPESPDSTA
jgi:cell wall-associated NlpC family hydrolase